MKNKHIDSETRTELRSAMDIIILVAICTAIGFAFSHFSFPEVDIILIYVVGIVIVAMRTKGHMASLFAACISVLSFNFFFSSPSFSFITDPSYLSTFGIMLVMAYMISSLTVMIRTAKDERIRLEERAKRESFQADLLRAISHDLRTPLAGISGNATLLKDHDQVLDREQRMEIYTAIEEDSLWLNDMVENLLSISRMAAESGKLKTNLELITELVDEALLHIDRNKDKHNIEVIHDEELILVDVDARLILQVIINLVNNAIKYTEEGSTIVIRTARKDDMAEISVADNGPGISEEARKRIFDQFYTLGKPVSDGRRGLGLGLYLCRSIVEAHNGTVKLESNEPHGAKFIFYLPAAQLNVPEE